ncbi:MAG TPA: SDR family NAD(P)-dependent oxidoreductase [Polyangiaceae bacterium]|nr:SDR family NAD(P)-dependent oxidoreductase [Polyangiaceae bacterium]
MPRRSSPPIAFAKTTSTATREPLAIVGVGCRLPGDVESLDDLRAVLLERRSLVSDVPADRWDAASFYHPDFRKAGHIHARRGAFLRRVDAFDAAFFGIAPAEARRIDPQQRLVLEASFRALEDAGLPWEAVSGRRVAVVIGCSGRDYDGIQAASSERDRIGPTTNTGSALSIVSNRVSYVFDLRGPSFSVDTACSSSLTAIHCACRAIWDGDAEAALAGGVNVVLRPEPTIGFSTGGFLSPDGECRAFSADANGYVRGEGVGVVVIKPLAAALAAGDRVYGVIRGTAINQDGRTLGMTMPSRTAQEDLLAAAYGSAGVEPARLAYVEAHGTGTPAGDPIEAEAIGRVLGRARPAGAPLFIGSVKTNLGHLESAAGMAGLFKLLLTLGDRRVYPNLHFRAPNPKIPFDALGLRVATEILPLPGGGPLFGGVNSFGFGGANAHVVIEGPPPAPKAPARPSPRPAAAGVVAPVFLSARTPEALEAMARETAERLRGEGVAEARGLALALATRRSSFEHRLAVVGKGVDELAARLAAFAPKAEAPAGVFTGRLADVREEPAVAFVFGGQGSQWWGMARTLLRTNEAFRATIDEVGGKLRALGWLADEGGSLAAELQKDESSSRMSETRVAQPCLFAVQLGVARLLEASGVRPAATVGHSIGELAAAVTAGALTADEATRIVYARSRCQARAEGKGSMAALGLGEAEARALLRGGEIDVAAVNGPGAVTVAGPSEAVRELGRRLEAEGKFFRLLDVGVPFHCRLMDPIEREFRELLGEVATAEGRVPFYSTVTGAELSGRDLGVDYWWKNIREPVLFEAAIGAMAGAKLGAFVEVGPHPILRRGGEETLRARGSRAAYVSTLRRDRDDDLALAECLAGLFVAGVRCAPAPVAAEGAGRLDLPRHPLAQTSHWQESAVAAARRTGKDRSGHPHVAALEPGSKEPTTFAAVVRFDAHVDAYLADHRVQGSVVVPGAAQLEAMAFAARRAGLGEAAFLEDVEFRRPVVVPAETDATELRLEVYGDEGHFVLASAGDDGAIEHSRGRVNHSGDRMAAPALDWAALRAFGGRALEPDALYDEARAAGLDLGPPFRTLLSFRTTGDETVAELELSESLAFDGRRHLVHPVLLDGMLQTAALGALSQAASGGRARGLFLPAGVGRFQIHAPHSTGRLWVYARSSGAGTGRDLVVDVFAADDEGEPCVSLQGLRLRQVPGVAREAVLREQHAYERRWERLEPLPPAGPAAGPPGLWIVLAPPSSRGRADAIARQLEARGKRALVAQGPVTDSLSRLREEASRVPFEGLVHLGTLDAGEPSSDASASERALVEGPVALATLLRASAGLPRAETLRLWLVTRGVFAIEPGELALPDASPLWGAGRVAMSELANATTTLLDLPAAPAEADWAALGRLLDEAEPAHAELASRGGEVYALRLGRAGAAPATIEVDLSKRDVRAFAQSPGVVSSVALSPALCPEPGPDELKVAVRAVGLNFKDVVVAMAMLPDRAWAGGMSGAELGMEFSGVVRAVGANVRDFAPGDEVMGLAPSSLGTSLLAHRHHVAKKPARLSFAAAAAVPTAYLTAALALEQLAGLAAGETVLIHAGTGGVGIAAVQIARAIGARVIATTSSDEKRAFLHRLGVEHVLGSRSPAFHDAALELTGGRGVDVVLNSLSGRMLSQGLRSLAPFGRFVEIGKVDIYKNRQISLDVFGENRAFYCLDVNRWASQRKEALGRCLAEGVRRIEAGEFAPLPTREFPLERAAEALSTLAQARHIGKVAVTVPAGGVVAAARPQRFAARPDGAYLVTGGCGGFGLAVARWLVERGARHLVLASRRGAVDPADAPALDEMRRAGAEVWVRACPVDDAGRVSALVAEIGQKAPLRGVFHAAMVLDDAPLAALDAARFRAVAAPKIAGAWNLHRAASGHELDAFVLFSSIASVVGSPGQGNYAAANAFLASFAEHRRGLGLPATCVHFGAIDDVGVVARAAPEQRRKILAHGVGAMRVGDALAMLEQALVEGATDRVAAAVDWARLPTAGRDRRFAALRAEGGGRAAAEGGERLSARVAAAEGPQKGAILVEAIARAVAKLVGAEGPVDADTSLERVGLDSLSAAQLEAWLRAELGATVPLVRLLRGPTVRALADELLAGGGKPAAAKAAPAWVRRHGEGAPSARIFCFPPMTMGHEAFDDWSSIVPPGVEVCSVELPALGGDEDALLRGPVAALRGRLVEELAPLLDVPFAFYGHSIGGWVALEVAAELRSRRGVEPSFLCLGSVPKPEVLASLVPKGAESPEKVSDAQVIDALRRLHFPEALLEEGGGRLRETVAAARRDLWLGARTGVASGEARGALGRVQSPVVVARGNSDPLPCVDGDDIAALGLNFGGGVSLDGGHLFLQETRPRRALAKALAPSLLALGGQP